MRGFEKTQAIVRLSHMRRKKSCHIEGEVINFLEKGHYPHVKASSTKPLPLAWENMKEGVDEQ